jgi:hypothetical protein
VKSPLTVNLGDEERTYSVLDRMRENKRIIFWGDIPPNTILNIIIDNYSQRSKVIERGAMIAYRVEATNNENNKELFILKGESILLSLPSVALGDKLFYALRYNGLTEQPTNIIFKKESERKATILEVRKAEE